MSQQDYDDFAKGFHATLASVVTQERTAKLHLAVGAGKLCSGESDAPAGGLDHAMEDAPEFRSDGGDFTGTKRYTK